MIRKWALRLYLVLVLTWYLAAILLALTGCASTGPKPVTRPELEAACREAVFHEFEECRERYFNEQRAKWQDYQRRKQLDEEGVAKT